MNAAELEHIRIIDRLRPSSDGVRRDVNFGSAHLLVKRMPEARARALLEAAVAAGVARLDTAPLYGHGGSEALVASVAAAAAGDVRVTTKVGLEPSPPPPRWRQAAGALMRGMPASFSAALRAARRGAPPPQSAGRSGRFETDAVKRSIERSLARLGAIDRLLLHEVHPADIDDELLALLTGYQRRGDVAVLGVATGNAVTVDALRRGHGLFGVAHISIDPLLPASNRLAPAELATHAHVKHVQFVGHGALGQDAHVLARVQTALRADRALAERWAAAVGTSRYAGAGGLATALLARAAAVGPGEMLVATSRPERVHELIAAASGALPLPADVRATLDALLRRMTAA